MLRSYVQIALRNLQRHKGYAFLNVAGLTTGITCALLLLLTVQHELSYDRFHPHADRLYRVVQDVSWGAGMTWDWTTPVMASALSRDFPEVEASVRLYKVSALVSYEEAGAPVRFQEDGFVFADPNVFDLFAFSFVQGDLVTALRDPQNVVITESVAEKYFGKASPIGKVLHVDIDSEIDLKVAGVLRDLPPNSHIRFDFVGSFEAVQAHFGDTPLDSWWWPNVTTYVRLSKDSDAADFNDGRLAEFIKRHREPHYAEAIIPRLQPVTGIHLYGPPGDSAIRFVYIFGAIGVFILLIACVNYMNLATARAAQRAQEVGVRKVLGAGRGQIARQFFGESVLMTTISVLAALALTELLLPFFRDLSGRPVALDFGAGWLWTCLLGFTAVVSVLAGGYPALVLSRFAPVRVLKGGGGRATRGLTLRRSLVVFQFTITIALIAGTLAVYRQVDYMRSASLGFDTEQVVALRLRDDNTAYPAFKDALTREPGVVSVSAANWYPGVGGGTGYAFALNGEDFEHDPVVFHADFDFFETLGIDVVAGRGFSESFPSDVKEAFVLNETAVRDYRIERPLESQVRLFAAENGRVVYDKAGPVIGIARDFNLTSLRAPITPVAVTMADSPYQISHILVRLAPGNTRAALDRLERLWQAHFPDRLFEATFVDHEINALYHQEEQFGRTIGVLAGLAVLIACLGLLGLAAFMAEQRTKEIGIRKVLGASVGSIVALLSGDFARLVVIAIVIAAPLAYYAVQRWLADFAYHIELSWLVFLLAGGAALAVALLTVSYHAVKAALSDPVTSLRYE